MLTRITAWIRAQVSRRRIAEEIDQELQYHVERATETHVARGVPAAEARRAATVNGAEVFATDSGS